MNAPNPKVDFFFEQAEQWQAEYRKLRTILLDCPLTEQVKWGVPCYTFEDKNVVLMHGFKEYCALLFVKGALLDDPRGLLIQQTENVQAGRQIRFRNLGEIVALEPVLKAYVQAAIQVEKAGLKIVHKPTSEFPTPEEWIDQLDRVSGLQEAFESLTPGRQRGYLLYFSAPKQSKTRAARIEKYTPQILAGKGLNDE